MLSLTELSAPIVEQQGYGYQQQSLRNNIDIHPLKLRNISLHNISILEMTAPDNFCLKWGHFESNLTSAFQELRGDNDLFDVTLVCEDRQVEAHKLVLSASSSFFKDILKKFKHPHPLVFLKGVKYSEILSILNFMYQGEVNIATHDLSSFLSVAEELKIKGLSKHNSVDQPLLSLSNSNQKRPVNADSKESPEKPSKRSRSGGEPSSSSTLSNNADRLADASLAGVKTKPEPDEEEDIIIPQPSWSCKETDITEQGDKEPGLDDIWSKLEKSGKIIRCRLCGLNKHQDFFSTLVNHIRKDHP